MNEEFKPGKIFTKNSDNLEMLRQSLESEKIDVDIVPILKKFFSLPITPRESCYGHPEKAKSPYLSYVEDDVQNELDENFQRLFKEKIGSEAIKISLEEIDHGGGPKDYTLRFEIVDKKIFQKNGKNFLDIIWEEFSKYIDDLKQKVKHTEKAEKE